MALGLSSLVLAASETSCGRSAVLCDTLHRSNDETQLPPDPRLSAAGASDPGQARVVGCWERVPMSPAPAAFGALPASEPRNQKRGLLGGRAGGSGSRRNAACREQETPTFHYRPLNLDTGCLRQKRARGFVTNNR